MAGGYSRSPEPRSLTSAVERFIVSNESMTKCTRSSCSTHSCKLGGKSKGVFRSMLTNRVATYSQRTSPYFYSNQSPTGSGEPRSGEFCLLGFPFCTGAGFAFGFAYLLHQLDQWQEQRDDDAADD